MHTDNAIAAKNLKKSNIPHMTWEPDC